MYAPEDGIGLGVLAGTLPPSFDDSGIVPMAPEVIVWAEKGGEHAGKELKGDCFGPSDVASLRLPVSDEGPCMPIFSHSDAKAHS